MTLPISVCVLACNEASELETCLASVLDFADEVVVVVDAKSTDESEAVARGLAARVEVRPYAGDVEQKRYCVGLAKHDWVFIIDPDEVASPALVDSIRDAFQSTLVPAADSTSTSTSTSTSIETSPGASAFRVNRATFHLGRWIRHGDFYPDWKLRLFRRSHARFAGRDPHGRVEVDGVVVDLEGDLEHRSYKDLADQVDRIQFFSDQAATALHAEGARFHLHHLVLRPPARFLRTYFLRQGFRDGLAGFVISVASAFYVFLKYAKLWERTR